MKDSVDSYLYLGTGRFHPIAIVLGTGKEVVMADPLTDEVIVIGPKDVEKLEKQKKSLKRDDYEIEKFARERFKLIKPGEEIVIIKKREDCRPIISLIISPLDYIEYANGYKDYS